MSRDDLVAALMLSPTNSEVRVRIVVSPDYFEEMCSRKVGNPKRECYVAQCQIDRVAAVPETVIHVIP